MSSSRGKHALFVATAVAGAFSASAVEPIEVADGFEVRRVELSDGAMLLGTMGESVRPGEVIIHFADAENIGFASVSLYEGKVRKIFVDDPARPLLAIVGGVALVDESTLVWTELSHESPMGPDFVVVVDHDRDGLFKAEDAYSLSEVGVDIRPGDEGVLSGGKLAVIRRDAGRTLRAGDILVQTEDHPNVSEVILLRDVATSPRLVPDNGVFFRGARDTAFTFAAGISSGPADSIIIAAPLGGETERTRVISLADIDGDQQVDPFNEAAKLGDVNAEGTGEMHANDAGQIFLIARDRVQVTQVRLSSPTQHSNGSLLEEVKPVSTFEGAQALSGQLVDPQAPLVPFAEPEESAVLAVGEPGETTLHVISPRVRQVDEHIAFDFETTRDDWRFASPQIFSAPVGVSGGGSIGITSNDSMNEFGFWESPSFTVGPGEETAGDITYHITVRARSDASDTSQVPVVRFRASTADFQRSDVLVITSTGNGELSPGTDSTEYKMAFSAPAELNRVRLFFDLLNFKDQDSANVTVFVDEVTLEVTPVAEKETLKYKADFTTGDLHGFTPGFDTGGELDPPFIEATGDGLAIKGDPAATGDQFGFWSGQTIDLVAGREYIARFKVATDGAVLPSEVPAFRLRLNDSSHQFAVYANIESTGDYKVVPDEEGGKWYEVEFLVPDSSDATQLIASFDYLLPAHSDNDPNAGILLKELEIWEVAPRLHQ